MEVSSVQRLCLHLISAAFQRCRVSEDLCRLSVVLKRSSDSDPSTVRVSISDTGIGTSLEEFQGLKFSREVFDAEKWDGVLNVQTTNIGDDEIYHYHLNLRESNSVRRLTRLPSNPKNGAKFSGTEIYLSISESIDVFLAEVIRFFQKILVLKIPNVAIELVAEEGGVPGSQYRKVFLANECNPVPFSASNVERLKSGLEDYVMKHGNSLHRKCDSCFPNWEHLKVGSGRACCAESHRSAGLQMEVVIIVSEISETSPCFRSSSAETEVLYFKDFSPCPITQSSLTALTNIDWKSYGLVLKSIAVQGGYTALEWENLPPNIHFDMVLHCYHKQYQFTPPGQKTRSNRNLIKKAAKLALDDLKEKHAGAFLSAHALKICSYAPDLARTIAGLILSSNDSEFQEECFSILGLQSQNIRNEIVEDSIQQKIISVIQMNDGKPLRSKEAASSFLFEDERLQEPNIQEEEYDAGEHVFSSLDF
ncbi:Type 2 DNA topoisomerase 6 subunit B-like [Citrus sinensis]|uniref:type 2 DNA topoisomerase 6 subunit B-like isoform X1 n=1 Tax=Citrus sinensis TaxID=2711 RepID=UPI0003D783FD|nr:type 2 DNA topoisomerase 6 subunit B-like isoform X1 [Citrus sinensis]KAH9708879.1 Type 2 DNA topoisomerase 6 subunit B-like [Citrus sinensis]